jgi:hypothetical protein
MIWILKESSQLWGMYSPPWSQWETWAENHTFFGVLTSFHPVFRLSGTLVELTPKCPSRQAVSSFCFHCSLVQYSQTWNKPSALCFPGCNLLA